MLLAAERYLLNGGRTIHTLAVQRFVCSGDYQENCYVVHSAAAVASSSTSTTANPFASSPEPPAGDCWIIDPGTGMDETIAFIRSHGLRPTAILLTHGHLDHIAGIPELCQAHPDLQLPIYIGRAEADALQSPQVNGTARLGVPLRLAQHPTRLLDDGDILSLGPLTFQVLLTPGHTAAGVCYYCPDSGDLFTGDVLFAGSVGRSDLPGGNARTLTASIRTKLLPLPDDTRVWPGHGDDTTIGHERRTNFFLCRSGR